jgi:hypothetical protein
MLLAPPVSGAPRAGLAAGGAAAVVRLAPLAAAVAGAGAQQEADGEQPEDDGDSPAAFDGGWNRDQQRADGRAQREDDVGHMDDRDTPGWR